jgi:hypothetical protein
LRLARLIRYRYPYTAATVVIALASAAAIWFAPWRKAGIIVIALLAWGFLARFIGEAGYRWSKRRDERRGP